MTTNEVHVRRKTTDGTVDSEVVIRWEEDEDVIDAIVDGVSRVSGVAPFTVRATLGTAIDTEALEALLTAGRSEEGGGHSRIRFALEDVDVEIDAGGTVTVRPTDEGAPSQAPRQSVTIAFADEDDIDIRQFCDTLRYLKTAYSYLRRHPDTVERAIGDETRERLAVDLERIGRLDAEAVTSTLIDEMAPVLSERERRVTYYERADEVYVRDVERGSVLFHLTVTAGGLVVVALLLVAICGGELTATPTALEVKMNKTLGEGLEDLRQLFEE